MSPIADTWHEPLRTLAPFAAIVREPGFVFGRWIPSERLETGVLTMPYYELADSGLELVRAAGAWVQAGFDWGTWSRTPEARRLIDDPAALAEASPEEIARLLTLLIRSDRFNEGQLAAAWDSGFLLRLLDRAAVLAAELG